VQRQRGRRAVVEVGGVLARSDRVREGERRAAGARAVGRRRAVRECENRGAGDGDVLAEGDGDRDRLAGLVGAVGGRGADARDGGRGRVVDEGAARGARVAGAVGGANGDRVGVAVREVRGRRRRVCPRRRAGGGVVEEGGGAEAGAVPVVAGAVLDGDRRRGDGGAATAVGGGAGEVRGQRGRVVARAVRGRGRHGGGRVGRVDLDVLLAAERARPADRRQGERRVVGCRVLDRAAVQGQRAGGRVVEVGRVLAGGDRVGEGERGAAGAAAVARGTARVQCELRRAGDGDVLAEGDGDRDRLAGLVGAVRRRGADARHRRRGRVVDEGPRRGARVAGAVGGANGDRVGVAVREVRGRGRCIRPGGRPRCGVVEEGGG